MAIVKRRRADGSTAWMVRVGRHPAKTFGTKAEARQYEGVLLNRHAPEGRESVASFYERWLVEYRANYESTQATNRLQAKWFVEEHGSRMMDSITHREARSWAIANPARVRGAAKMFSDAVRDGVVTENVFAGVPRPKYSRADEEPPDEAGIWRLAEACDVLGAEAPVFRAMVLTAAFTGVRFGELVALEWPDVGDGTLRVVRSYMAQGDRFKVPKSGQGAVIALPAPALEAIRAMPRRLGACSKARSPEGFVFRPKRAQHFRPCSHHDRWKLVREEAGEPDLAWHMLRHACATMMLRNGATPEMAAQQLRHRDGGNLIRQRYGHLLSDASVMAALDGIRSALPSHTPAQEPSVRRGFRVVG